MVLLPVSSTIEVARIELDYAGRLFLNRQKLGEFHANPDCIETVTTKIGKVLFAHTDQGKFVNTGARDKAMDPEVKGIITCTPYAHYLQPWYHKVFLPNHTGLVYINIDWGDIVLKIKRGECYAQEHNAQR